MLLLKNILPTAALVFALGFLPQCAEKKSDDYVREGVALTEAQDYGRALAAFESAIKKDPKNARAYFSLGGIYNYRNDHAKALDLFQTAVRLDPTYIDAYYGLGYTYEIMGKTAESKSNYEKYRDLKSRYDGFLKTAGTK